MMLSEVVMVETEPYSKKRKRKEFFRVKHELMCNYWWEFTKNYIEHAQEKTLIVLKKAKLALSTIVKHTVMPERFSFQ